MAGRFGRLEFDQRGRVAPPRADATYGTAARDADHFFEQAQQARCWGDHDVALRLYTRTLTEDRSRIAAWVGQVQMLVQLAEYHEARLWADKALEVFPKHGDLMAAKAQSCARIGDHRTAMACSDASLTCSGTSAWRWIVRGEVLLAHRHGHHTDCFDRVMAEPDLTWFDRLVIAEVHMYYGHHATALQHAQSATRLQPSHGYGWFVQGQCQALLGWTQAAEDSYARCLELAPKYRAARIALETLARTSFFSRLLRRLNPWAYR